MRFIFLLLMFFPFFCKSQTQKVYWNKNVDIVVYDDTINCVIVGRRYTIQGENETRIIYVWGAVPKILASKLKPNDVWPVAFELKMQHWCLPKGSKVEQPVSEAEFVDWLEVNKFLHGFPCR